jgi:hypothetical protein
MYYTLKHETGWKTLSFCPFDNHPSLLKGSLLWDSILWTKFEAGKWSSVFITCCVWWPDNAANWLMKRPAVANELQHIYTQAQFIITTFAPAALSLLNLYGIVTKCVEKKVLNNLCTIIMTSLCKKKSWRQYERNVYQIDALLLCHHCRTPVFYRRLMFRFITTVPECSLLYICSSYTFL